MKFFAVSLLAGLAAATPIAMPAPGIALSGNDVEARQFGLGSKNELEQGQAGSCPKLIFVFARGSTEQGNLGTLGEPLGQALERKYGANQVWVQGVGGPYLAGVFENTLPRGSCSACISEMVRLLKMAGSKCPNSKIVAGGYSQGAALCAAAVSDTPSDVRDKIVGTVLFGYTKNMQNRGQIPNYPADRTKVFCAPGDLVCVGTLTITAAHLGYGLQAMNEAPRFLESKIDGSN